MKTLYQLVLVTLLILLSKSSHSQDKKEDEIYVKNSFFSYKYYIGDSNISKEQVLNLLSSDQLSYDLMRISYVNATVSAVLKTCGIVLISATIETLFSENEPVLAFAGIGAGFFIASTIYSRKHKKQAYRAISRYNDKLGLSQNEQFREINLFYCGNSVKLTISL